MTTEYSTLVDELLMAIPELEELNSPELRVARDLPHVVFETVLATYLISLLEHTVPSTTIDRIFAFLEALATHPDVRVREVVQVSVCERLGDRKDVLERACRYMGPATLRLSREIEKQLGRQEVEGIKSRL